MTFARKTTTPRSGKGQIKCNNCRELSKVREGAWHDRNSQQIFLCNDCNRELAAAAADEARPKEAPAI